MATGFSGGLGNTREELCGALSGGVMVIGALFGRASSQEDDELAIELADAYRTRFLEEFGHTQCGELRDRVVEMPGGFSSCGELVEHSAAILLRLLSEAG